MAVTVEIKTGSRRIIEYLMAPLLRYKHESLRERRGMDSSFKFGQIWSGRGGHHSRYRIGDRQGEFAPCHFRARSACGSIDVVAAVGAAP